MPELPPSDDVDLPGMRGMGMTTYGTRKDGTPFVRCDEGDRLYMAWHEVKMLHAGGDVALMLKLAEMDDLWEAYQAHVKACEVCTHD